jgi:ubiquinone biosynthesis protein
MRRIGTRLRGFSRLFHIARILLRWRLDELIDATRLFGWLRPLRGWIAPSPAGIESASRGERLRRALEELGPIFVKFGQILSTRRDLLPTDVADQLVLLQDRVAPFPGEIARTAVERALGKPIDELYARFDLEPLASASIAQVHAAALPDGREVVVKVLRPDIAKRIDTDLALLHGLGELAARYSPNAEHVRPLEVVAEIERTLRDELDFQREGANASTLRRYWQDSPDLYVPEVHWHWSAETVLTLERVHGIPSDNIAAIEAAGISRTRLAAKAVTLFYQQVFRDNFFHADAHPGNVWVDATRTDEPRFIALDFGIMGALPPADQYYLAANFEGIFTRDYRRIAELHIEAGWMPDTIRVDDLEAAVRAVCEPYFTRPLAEISLGEVLVKLFKVAHRYQLTVQPQLLLLQKTLLNVEGLGRLLDPKLDIWAVAHPVLEQILREKYSLATVRREFEKRLPDIARNAPELPRLVHRWLEQQVHGEQVSRIRAEELAQLADGQRRGQRASVRAILGGSLVIAGAVLVALGGPGPTLLGVPWLAITLLSGGGLAFLAATRAAR